MNSITVILIVVIALLTVAILGLTWLAYSSCLKTYRTEVDQGLHDKTIHKEYCDKKKSKAGLVGVIGSYIALFAFLSLFVTGIIYKARGENFTINNTTALVIKTGSMSRSFEEGPTYDTSLQFDVGDICFFETEFDLTEGEVYGYKNKQDVITHRLISIRPSGLCEFKGDANAIPDMLLVSPENIIYHYTGNRIPGLGAFVLYAQSYFGIWSLAGMTTIAIGSEVVYYKLDKINKERSKWLDD